jgi:RimJ/RimL family protein N-acetyltransferase
VTREISNREVAAPSGRSPEKRPMQGRLARLEPMDVARHAEGLYAASHGSEEAKRVWTYLPHGPFADVAGFRDWAARMLQTPERLFFAIRNVGTQQLAGMAMYSEMHPAHGVSEVGYVWFAPSVQRTPLATEALYLMLRHAFDDLKYRRMQWRCNALNEKSRAAALRLGFKFEGIFYQQQVVKGRNRDTAWFSMLDSEWPRIRANFERWLAPENFDAQGRQRSSLSRLNACHAVG